MICGKLISVLLLCNASTHTLLLASAPTSPIKGILSRLKIVSSSIVTPSMELYAQGFDDKGM